MIFQRYMKEKIEKPKLKTMEAVSSLSLKMLIENECLFYAFFSKLDTILHFIFSLFAKKT